MLRSLQIELLVGMIRKLHLLARPKVVFEQLQAGCVHVGGRDGGVVADGLGAVHVRALQASQVSIRLN